MTAIAGRQITIKEVIDDLESRMRQEELPEPSQKYFHLKEVKEHWEKILQATK